MKKGFTLAEVLITLAIIGVIAVLTIPVLISAYEQNQYKTGLKKAVNALNAAIATNIATEEETPLANSDIFNYLMRHMAVLKTTSKDEYTNYSFYTTDGMRFEFERPVYSYSRMNELKLHESDTNINMACYDDNGDNDSWGGLICTGCGSYGLDNNPSNSKTPPCYILVDVNGDKKPTKAGDEAPVWNPDNDLNSNVTGDSFTVMITEREARPFGVVAQKAMYGK